MKVKDLMIKNVISVGKDDSVTLALNKMKKHGISQIPVVDGSKYIGMLCLKTIVTKSIDPSQAKCGNFLSNVPSIRSNKDAEQAIELMLNSGVRALPVIDDTLVGIVSETDVIGALPTIAKGLLDLSIGSIASDCEYVTKNDSSSKVKKIMLYKNVSRVPVVDNDKVIGVVGMIDMIKIMEGRKEMAARGGKTKEQGAKEKLNIEDVAVGNCMHAPAVISKEASLKDVLSSLTRFEEAIILDNGVKIVTPKDILELVLSGPKKTVQVQVIGMQDESAAFNAKIDRSVNDFVSRMSKMIEGMQYIFMHVEKSHKGGKKHLYLIRSRMGTSYGMFVAQGEGWDPITVAQDVLDKLEKEALHKTGKVRDERKHRNVLTKKRN